MDALILAGGTCSPEMQAATGVGNRALVELSPGHSMLGLIVGALQEAKTIDRLFVVGDIPRSAEYTLVAPGADLMDNVLAGLRAIGPTAKNVLLVSSDIPFITARAVDDFVQRAQELGAGLCYPIIPIAACQAQYAGLKRTTLRLKEGEFTGGNVILADARLLTNNEAAVRAAYAARKSVFRLGTLLGWGLLLRVVASQAMAPRLLSIPDLEAGIAFLLGEGATARAVITEHASLGTDIDKPADVEAARQILSAEKHSATG